MIGIKIHNYRIEKLIGEGGMGNVYLAKHLQFDRDVAIKVLHPNLAKNENIRQRFKKEAATLSQLQHPNIVSLFDYIEEEENAFLIMEYVEGKPLDIYIDTVSGPIPEEKTIQYINKILDALEYAHEKNVVHRDIKPSNIIITPKNEIKILDFGIAKILGESNKKLTKTGSKIGTVLYMSPEQVKGYNIDKRTDIYALGVTLFQMLTGKCPYSADSTEYEIYSKIVNEPLPTPTSIYPIVSNYMERIVAKATSKIPDYRFQNCSELREALKNKELSAPKKKEIQKINEKFLTKKNKLKLKILATIVLLIICSTIGYFMFSAKYPTQKILAHEAVIYSMTDTSSMKIASLTFGSNVRIKENEPRVDRSGVEWYMVETDDNRKGYVLEKNICSQTEYEQIRLIMNDFADDANVPVEFKKTLRSYFLKKGLFSQVDKTPFWFLARPKAPDVQPYGFADFDSNNKPDYICLLESQNSSYKLVIILNNNIDTDFTITNFQPEYLIQVIPKGLAGGKWFLGKITQKRDSWGRVFTDNLLEMLPSEGLLMFNLLNNEKFVYLYDFNRKEFVAFKQP